MEYFINRYPDPALLRKSVNVEGVSPCVRDMVAGMIKLLTAEVNGIGLSAPQVGCNLRIFVVNLPFDPTRPGFGKRLNHTDGPRVYINPVLSAPEGKPEPMQEGCLSAPGVRVVVKRHPCITITSTDLDGKEWVEDGYGLLARCWQHEVDHLDGINIVDYLNGSQRIKVPARPLPVA